jgi:DNA-binding MarR family transcriptional regulator
MDDVLFGVKRAYWASAGFAARKLAKYGITPARLNLLRVIYAGPGRRVSQRYVRHHLGVARSTVCRMIRALEGLGLVERDGSRLAEDRRTLMCALTQRGRRKRCASRRSPFSLASRFRSGAGGQSARLEL